MGFGRALVGEGGGMCIPTHPIPLAFARFEYRFVFCLGGQQHPWMEARCALTRTLGEAQMHGAESTDKDRKVSWFI